VSSKRPPLARLTTGSAAFDRILGGGLPVRSVSVIAGAPGAGKTLFALQMLFALARQGKKGLYFSTLSEPSLKLLQYMQQFSFFEESLLEARIVFADLGSVIRKGADATLAEISSRVEAEEAAVVVIDSFKAVRDILGDPAVLRTFVYDLAVHLSGWGRPACSWANTRRQRRSALPSLGSPMASSGFPTPVTSSAPSERSRC
jgi:circadian clock protein KaiC